MSSSEDDSDEYYDASPEVQAPSSRSTRRKAQSPRAIPKKKAKALADFNLAIDDSDDNDSEEEVIPTRKGRVGLNGGPRGQKRAAEVDDDASESGGSSRSPEETENRPPTASFILNADIPEESSQPPNGAVPSRSRKRLSIRGGSEGGSAVSEGRRSSISSGVGGAESVVATNEVQTIYETCSQMFNANRINPQNAFNLRLLDCINQMINSPNYDKSNMQLTSSTVEIGTKIYVCRVDNTHSQVLSLASDITLQQQRKRKKDGGPGEGEGDGQMGDDGGMNADDVNEDEEGGARRQKTKKRIIKKRGKFVEEDNSKLLTGLEEQNVKFVTRRNFLKKKFNEMIFDDLDFDYLSYFLEPEDEHPLKTGAEEANMKSQMVIPETYVNQLDMTRMEFLPFSHMTKYDPETHDIWGMSLNSMEMNRAEISQGPQLPLDNDYAYDPAERPNEYPDEGGPDMNDTLGEALPHFNDNGEEGNIPAVSFHDIRSLDHLDNYFQRIRSLLKDNKSKYGWCGPNYVRPKATWGVQPRGTRKAKARKEPEKIDFRSIDWSDKANKFAPNHSVTAARTVFDDKIIEMWSTQKVIIPFLGIELNDEEFDPIDFENETDPSYVPAIFKLFLSRHRSILELFRGAERRKRHGSEDTSMGPPSVGEDGFDNDIELPRDVVEDICSSQPMTEDGFHNQADTALPEAAWQFPGSLPGLLNDDPLSAVSGVDSIRFSRKPKPIDMSALKKGILKILSEKLLLDVSGRPLQDEETAIGLAQLMYHVLQQIGSRTEKLMSVPIFVVALMHVVADKKLFVVYDEATDPECPVVVCRGKSWVHADHIPMPNGDCEEE